MQFHLAIILETAAAIITDGVALIDDRFKAQDVNIQGELQRKAGQLQMA